MLSLSKHGGAGLSAYTLRQAQGDSALLDCEQSGVMLRYSKHGARGFFVFTVLFCLFLSGNVHAQNSNSKIDTIPKKVKTIYQLYEHIKTQPGTSDPLIMVDDSVYNGDLNNIKSEDVTSVSIIKGEDAKAIFGPKAKNGVFNIKLKHHEHKLPILPGPELKFSDGPVVYVMDGMPIPKEFANTNDILFKEVVKGKKLEELGSYSNKKLDSVVFITTINHAIVDYQMKFSIFSKKYEDYLAMHKNNDEDFLYVLDGVRIPGKRGEIVKALFEIPIDIIKEVEFNEKQPTSGSQTVVVINTKQ